MLDTCPRVRSVLLHKNDEDHGALDTDPLRAKPRIPPVIAFVSPRGAELTIGLATYPWPGRTGVARLLGDERTRRREPSQTIALRGTERPLSLRSRETVPGDQRPSLADEREESRDLGGERLGLLERGEVPAALGLAPAADVGEARGGLFAGRAL